jgi:hypothetical protein
MENPDIEEAIVETVAQLIQEEFVLDNTDDDDMNEELGAPACNLGEACESCQ